MGMISIIFSALIVALDPIGQLKRSRDTDRKSDIHQMQAALELYRSDQDSYPTDLPNCGTSFQDICSAPKITYLKTVQTDPNGQPYYYERTSTGGYEAAACLENNKDKDGTLTRPSTAGVSSDFVINCASKYYFVATNP